MLRFEFPVSLTISLRKTGISILSAASASLILGMVWWFASMRETATFAVMKIAIAQIQSETLMFGLLALFGVTTPIPWRWTQRIASFAIKALQGIFLFAGVVGPCLMAGLLIAEWSSIELNALATGDQTAFPVELRQVLISIGLFTVVIIVATTNLVVLTFITWFAKNYRKPSKKALL